MKLKSKKNIDSPSFSLFNKVFRVLWGSVYYLFFRFSPTPLFAYRRMLLSLFGAKLARGVRVYPSVKIWLPSNLYAEEGVTLGPSVNIYNQGEISIACNTIISQGVSLCASTHDYNDPKHPLVLASISVGSYVWLCADSFVGPGVSIPNGCVVGARAVVFGELEPWGVYAGNPAMRVKQRDNFINRDEGEA